MIWHASRRLLLVALGLTGLAGAQRSKFTHELGLASYPAAIASAPAQAPQAGSSPIDPYTLRVNADEVLLNCTVLDSKGNLVNDLKKEDFRVTEDKIPQKVISLQHQE